MSQNSNLNVAFYARVSSDQQAKEQTIDSQILALHQRIQNDGLTIQPNLAFVDNGFSGTTLLRPALEQLRDQIAAGTIDRLYVLAPDRLARKYAYQVLLLDEFKRANVEVVFLNHAIGSSPWSSPKKTDSKLRVFVTFKLHRILVAYRRMPADAVIKNFDVLKDT